jgi:hypothetical protein
MHEIPNFPLSQSEPEQSMLAQQELGQPVVMKQAEDSQQASSED